MRVTLTSVDECELEIAACLENEDSIRGEIVRFVRADSPVNSDRDCLVFESALLLSFVAETLPEPTLYETIISYGVGAPLNTEKAQGSDQPRQVREAELVKFQEWCKGNGVKLRPGKIELF